MKAYLALSQQCFRDLYRVAYIATGNPVAAARLVEKTCVSGVHACENMRELLPIKIKLTGLLYDHCMVYLNQAAPDHLVVADFLSGLPVEERLLAVIRHCAGLCFGDVCKALDMSEHTLSEKMRKAAHNAISRRKLRT